MKIQQESYNKNIYKRQQKVAYKQWRLEKQWTREEFGH